MVDESEGHAEALVTAPGEGEDGAPPSVEATLGVPSEPRSVWISEGDAVRWLEGLESESVDLVVTDPPYESLEKHRAVGTTTRLKHSKSSSNDWFTVFPNVRFPELFREVHRVLRRNTHFYLFCDQETAFLAKPAGEAAGFKFWKPLVWDKQKIGMGYHYRSRYELILFFEKGKRRLNDLGIADVLTAPRIHRGYPTEKPVSINKTLIEQSSVPGEIVIDPFMGTASAGTAALEAGRSFWGCDLSPKAVSIAEERLLAAAEHSAAWGPVDRHRRRPVRTAARPQLALALEDPSVEAVEATTESAEWREDEEP